MRSISISLKSFWFYTMYFVCPIISFDLVPRTYIGGIRPILRKRYQCECPCSRSNLRMAFDTFVKVSSSYEARCTSSSPIPPDAKNIHGQVLSLSDYMRLPVDQYVCIKMPLDAVLERDRSDPSQFSSDSKLPSNRFVLTVPPVRFFNLDVSPQLFCNVEQSDDVVTIRSKECVLRGSPYVVSLNGCFKIDIKTTFQWTDTAAKKSITSTSKIFVEVDPPIPFKYFGKAILESTGTLAMSIALRQIENAFVQSLAKDYEHWITDPDYRKARAVAGSSAFALPQPVVVAVDEAQGEQQSGRADDIQESVDLVVLEEINTIQDTAAMEQKLEPELEPKPVELVSELDPTPDLHADEIIRILDSAPDVSTLLEPPSAPLAAEEEYCLLPGEPPVVTIEEAPLNARRIFATVDVHASSDGVWNVLTAYEKLQRVVPSLVKNEVLFRTKEGGARLSQVGGAKVLPGITFTAKTVLDVAVFPESAPLSDSMLAEGPPAGAKAAAASEFYRNEPLRRGQFPRPALIPSLPKRDITMQNVEGVGDFDHYQGVWRVQPLPYCAPVDGVACRLSYAVEIRPKGFLPVGLIQSRIASDLSTNLAAIRDFVEKEEVEAKALIEKEQKEVKADEQVDFIVSSLSEERSAMIATASSIATLELSETSLQISPTVAVSELVPVEEPQPTDSLEGVLVVETELASPKAEIGKETQAETKTMTVTVVTTDDETKGNSVSLGFRASLYQGFQAALSSLLGLTKPETSEIVQESETLRLRKRVAELEKEIDDLKSRVAEKNTIRQK